MLTIAARGLDRLLFLRPDNPAICGPSDVGKSWLACALGYKACRDDRSVLYQSVPRLFAPWHRRAGMVAIYACCASSAVCNC